MSQPTWNTLLGMLSQFVDLPPCFLCLPRAGRPSVCERRRWGQNYPKIRFQNAFPSIFLFLILASFNVLTAIKERCKIWHPGISYQSAEIFMPICLHLVPVWSLEINQFSGREIRNLGTLWLSQAITLHLRICAVNTKWLFIAIVKHASQKINCNDSLVKIYCSKIGIF